MKKTIMEKYGFLILASKKSNESVKKTFGFEWSLLKQKEVNVWNLTDEEFKQQLWDELKIPDQEFKNMIIADIGCGHGRSGSLIADKSLLAFCTDVGLSIEQAAAQNNRKNCFFLQADLHNLPFPDYFFDFVYCSGVLHHTPNTEIAFNKVANVVNGKGIYCVWLYHPFNNIVHKAMLALRKVTIYIPIKLQFWLYMIFLLPFHKLISTLKGKPKGWREIMINQLDMLSPKYRYEHEPEEVTTWYKKDGFSEIEVTTNNSYGFSIKGRRNKII
ncbi:MAG: class I SAM-dependent methyltransferase [Chitinophagaceae bacterium]|nr:class I SAM-dependent methyltransferase [Chitinophagaceae bacterium]